MQLTEHVHMLRIPFTLTVNPHTVLERFVNIFVVVGERVFLIDSGVAGSEHTLLAYLLSLDRQPGDVSHLLLTHSHPDHIGAAAALRKLTGCIVAAHAAERAWIEDIDLQFKGRPIPGFYSLVGGPTSIDRLLKEGDVLDAGGVHVAVFHTPGHSPGSVSLLVREDKALISGDALPLPGGLPIYEDYAASLASIGKLRRIVGVDTLLSSWDAPRTGKDIPVFMDASAAYVRHIQELVERTAGQGFAGDLMDLCKKVAADLGLPPGGATPHLARSFAAHLRARSA